MNRRNVLIIAGACLLLLVVVIAVINAVFITPQAECVWQCNAKPDVASWEDFNFCYQSCIVVLGGE